MTNRNEPERSSLSLVIEQDFGPNFEVPIENKPEIQKQNVEQQPSEKDIQREYLENHNSIIQSKLAERKRQKELVDSFECMQFYVSEQQKGAKNKNSPSIAETKKQLMTVSHAKVICENSQLSPLELAVWSPNFQIKDVYDMFSNQRLSKVNTLFKTKDLNLTLKSYKDTLLSDQSMRKLIKSGKCETEITRCTSEEKNHDLFW